MKGSVCLQQGKERIGKFPPRIWLIPIQALFPITVLSLLSLAYPENRPSDKNVKKYLEDNKLSPIYNSVTTKNKFKVKLFRLPGEIARSLEIAAIDNHVTQTTYIIQLLQRHFQHQANK